MSKAEIIAELDRLSPDDLSEVQAKLDELAADAWQDRGELSGADKQALDATLAAFEKSPDAGSSWEEVKARAGEASIMSHRIIIRIEAEVDITDAAIWHEQQEDKLGREF